MPSSPLLTTPPNTTSNPPPLKESVFDLEENARAREASQRPNASGKSYDPEVGLAIDLRKLADARREVEMKLKHGWGSSLTSDQIFEEQCALAGISVRRGIEVSERASEWPDRTELEACA